MIVMYFISKLAFSSSFTILPVCLLLISGFAVFPPLGDCNRLEAYCIFQKSHWEWDQGKEGESMDGLLGTERVLQRGYGCQCKRKDTGEVCTTRSKLLCADMGSNECASWRSEENSESMECSMLIVKKIDRTKNKSIRALPQTRDLDMSLKNRHLNMLDTSWGHPTKDYPK